MLWAIELEFRSVVFEERKKLEYPEKNLSEQGREPEQTQPNVTPSLGIEPGALTTAPSLLHPCSSSPHNWYLHTNHDIGILVEKLQELL